MSTNPPFMREKGAVPFHLRPYTPTELEQHRRMVNAQEKLRKHEEKDDANRRQHQ